MDFILSNCRILGAGPSRMGSVHIRGGLIWGVVLDEYIPSPGEEKVPRKVEGTLLGPETETIDLKGRILLPGGIDAHVHFREPGMTRKADIASESRASLLGGITSFVDMPNNNPPATSAQAIAAKLELAKGRSYANYGFHIGATNTNISEIEALCRCGSVPFAGVKVFMGSSTGGMLVERQEALEGFFSLSGRRILIHSEDEGIIRSNLEKAKEEYGDDIPFGQHPVIRSRTACIRSTIKALEMAMRHSTPLHILHVSTMEEVQMIRTAKGYNPSITAETSPNYLYFCDEDYPSLGARLKCNPAVKSARDRDALIDAFADGTIDTIGTDHAPHLLCEKDAPYTRCPSGVPSITQSLSVLFTICSRYDIPFERIADTTSGKCAELFGIPDRGRISPGLAADLTVVDPDEEITVGDPSSILSSSSASIPYKCAWSPYEGRTLRGAVKMVVLGGEILVRDGALLDETPHGRPLSFQ